MGRQRDLDDIRGAAGQAATALGDVVIKLARVCHDMVQTIRDDPAAFGANRGRWVCQYQVVIAQHVHLRADPQLDARASS